MGELAGRRMILQTSKASLRWGVNRSSLLLRPEMDWRQPWVSLMKPGRAGGRPFTSMVNSQGQKQALCNDTVAAPRGLAPSSSSCTSCSVASLLEFRARS
jgi:hypothetical protein